MPSRRAERQKRMKPGEQSLPSAPGWWEQAAWRAPSRGSGEHGQGLR